MSNHPFRYEYIGLGLRDDASIKRDGDTWTADYLDIDGKRYMRVKIGPDHVELRESHIDGSPGSVTWHRNLLEAIALHSLNCLGREPSEFKKRLMLQTPGPTAWVPLREGYVIAFVPAIAMATVRIPYEDGISWSTPAPGPLATKLGISFADQESPDSPAPAVLVSSYAGYDRPETEYLIIRRIRVPAIVVPELMTQLYERGQPRFVQERPYVDLECTDTLSMSWVLPPGVGRWNGKPLLTYSIEEDVRWQNARSRSACERLS